MGSAHQEQPILDVADDDPDPDLGVPVVQAVARRTALGPAVVDEQAAAAGAVRVDRHWTILAWLTAPGHRRTGRVDWKHGHASHRPEYRRRRRPLAAVRSGRPRRRPAVDVDQRPCHRRHGGHVRGAGAAAVNDGPRRPGLLGHLVRAVQAAQPRARAARRGRRWILGAGQDRRRRQPGAGHPAADPEHPDDPARPRRPTGPGLHRRPAREGRQGVPGPGARGGAAGGHRWATGGGARGGGAARAGAARGRGRHGGRGLRRGCRGL